MHEILCIHLHRDIYRHLYKCINGVFGKRICEVCTSLLVYTANGVYTSIHEIYTSFTYVYICIHMCIETCPSYKIMDIDLNFVLASYLLLLSHIHHVPKPFQHNRSLLCHQGLSAALLYKAQCMNHSRNELTLCTLCDSLQICGFLLLS